MDAVFDAQFRLMKHEFASRGIEIEVAYHPNGEVDHIYRADRMLVNGTRENVEALNQLLPGIEWVDREQEERGEQRPRATGVAGEEIPPLRQCTTDALRRREMSLPETLELIDERLGRPADEPGGVPVATPDHVLHISRICPAVEPEVPPGGTVAPWPAPRPVGSAVRRVLVGVSDTGLLEKLDPARYPWLDDVTGEADPLGPLTPRGLHRIPAYAGHGTFIAGVLKCEAPTATVLVNNHFSVSGGELESVMVGKVEELVAQGVDVINLSAGTYTRNNWTSLGFHHFRRLHPGVVLVVAAGNDSTSRPFYPAAYPWSVAVGALGTDQQHLAWFSNYGPWVDVYALGEGMVNAFATGEYKYREPPKMPAVQTFHGMARWDGTSFSAPLVAGLVAERMARTGDSSSDAAAAVLKLAAGQALPGVGPSLFPGDAA